MYRYSKRTGNIYSETGEILKPDSQVILDYVLQGNFYEILDECPEDDQFLKGNLFIYNDLDSVNLKDVFSEWINFYLIGTAEINSYGDKSKIIWKTQNGKVAIEEFPVYTRSFEGSGLLGNFILERTLTIRYYKYNGEFFEVTLPTKRYSNKERIEADKKSRNTIIERTRELTGSFIYQQNMLAGTPEKISIEIEEALKTFSDLASYITVYREDREHLPLVHALEAMTPRENFSQATIDFIKNQVNINYY